MSRAADALVGAAVGAVIGAVVLTGVATVDRATNLNTVALRPTATTSVAAVPQHTAVISSQPTQRPSMPKFSNYFAIFLFQAHVFRRLLSRARFIVPAVSVTKLCLFPPGYGCLQLGICGLRSCCWSHQWSLPPQPAPSRCCFHHRPPGSGIFGGWKSRSTRLNFTKLVQQNPLSFLESLHIF